MSKKISSKVRDEYYTPKYGVEVLKGYTEKYKTIWCPFDKEWSNYVKVFKEWGHDVIYTHIDSGEDFLTYVPDFHFDCIISNPPFSIKMEIMKKCAEYKKPYMLLLPQSLFLSKSATLSLPIDLQVLIITDRITFDGGNPNFCSWYMGGNKFFDNDINFAKLSGNARQMWRDEYLPKQI